MEERNILTEHISIGSVKFPSKCILFITSGASCEGSNKENYSAQLLPTDPTKYFTQHAITRGVVELMHLLFAL